MVRSTLFLLTGFICGAVVMAAELSATRLLAPYFGASLVVWTVVIGVIMAALGLGNLLGGRLADQGAGFTRLLRLLALAGLWLAVVPWLGRHLMLGVALLLALLFPSQVLLAGTVASCLVLFAPPFFLLGMVTPWLVKLDLLDLTASGRRTGRLSAAATLGGIVGTFLPTFVTLPLLGTARSFWLWALLLQVPALLWPLARQDRDPDQPATDTNRTILPAGSSPTPAPTAASASLVEAATLPRLSAGVAGLFLLTLIFATPPSFAFWIAPLHESESQYNYLQINDTGEHLVLATHVAVGQQSVLAKSGVLSQCYQDLALLGAFFRPPAASPRTGRMRPQSQDGVSPGDAPPPRVLIIGLGAGTFARLCRHFLPGCVIDGVEIDAAIVALARRHFRLDEAQARVVIADGRAFLTGLPADAPPYDLVLLDAYREVTPPTHLVTREFFAAVRERLASDGVMVVNLNLHAAGAPQLRDGLLATVRAIFPHTFSCQLPGDMTTLLYASPSPASRDHFRRWQGALAENAPLAGPAARLAAHLREVPADLPAAPFTDDRCPVDLLAQRVLDRLLQDLLREITTRVFLHGLDGVPAPPPPAPASPSAPGT